MNNNGKYELLFFKKFQNQHIDDYINMIYHSYVYMFMKENGVKIQTEIISKTISNTAVQLYQLRELWLTEFFLRSFRQ